MSERPKTHRERAEEGVRRVKPWSGAPSDAETVARLTFPDELVTWLREACNELEFQADNYDCDCNPERHLCCVPRLELIVRHGRSALALYEEEP